ncbi:vWA domain-containing protein [Actinomycetospora sp. CA-084318]|uniref:vWA domain-containing protein n=1 Tax=Actinomycetospora sp. CA-084318 TaxID=3239892 RepID=UPI003D9954B6
MSVPAGAKILPFYLVVDVSYSMLGPKLDSANEVMPAVRDALAKNPILADKVRFSVIDFGDEARVRLPLCDPLTVGTLPTMNVRGMTSYASAFWELRTAIETDVKQLKADGLQVHRPAVFFLSDGLPTDHDDVWRQAFADLTQTFREWPNVIPCGVDQADPAVMQELIHPATGPKKMQMYMMERGADAGQAINAVTEILISSVIASGASLARGEKGIVLPDQAQLPPGIVTYSAEDDDFL